jgi:hypothetical protein
LNQKNEIIAIVGSSHSKDKGYTQIKNLIESYPKDTIIISGGAKGIDTLAIKIANELGYETKVYLPKTQTWPDFKIRNLKIASIANKIYSFADPLLTKPCYHCKNANKNNNHQVTGGCYTGLHNGNYNTIIIEDENQYKPHSVSTQYRIYVKDLIENPNKVYLFGDNLLGKGKGGQAIIRDEDNAFGIPTKKKPSTSNDSYFTDNEYDSNIKAINEAIDKIPKDKDIVIPREGIGTGLSKLKEKAPKTFNYLQSSLKELGFENKVKVRALDWWEEI